MFWPIKNSGEVFSKLKDIGYQAVTTSADHYRGYHLLSCQNVCDALSFLLDNIYIRFDTKLYRFRWVQIVFLL